MTSDIMKVSSTFLLKGNSPIQRYPVPHILGLRPPADAQAGRARIQRSWCPTYSLIFRANNLPQSKTLKQLPRKALCFEIVSSVKAHQREYRLTFSSKSLVRKPKENTSEHSQLTLIRSSKGLLVPCPHPPKL